MLFYLYTLFRYIGLLPVKPCLGLNCVRNTNITKIKSEVSKMNYKLINHERSNFLNRKHTSCSVINIYKKLNLKTNQMHS